MRLFSLLMLLWFSSTIVAQSLYKDKGLVKAEVYQLCGQVHETALATVTLSLTSTKRNAIRELTKRFSAKDIAAFAALTGINVIEMMEEVYTLPVTKTVAGSRVQKVAFADSAEDKCLTHLGVLK